MKNRPLTIAVLALLVGGCSQPDRVHSLPSPSTDIPTTALFVGEGSGRLFFQAPDPGVIYIYDADTTHRLFFTPIQREQRFVLDARVQRASIEGKTVYEQPFDRAHTYRIYFEPNGTPPPAPVVVPPPVFNPQPSSKPAA